MEGLTTNNGEVLINGIVFYRKISFDKIPQKHKVVLVDIYVNMKNISQWFFKKSNEYRITDHKPFLTKAFNFEYFVGGSIYICISVKITHILLAFI